MRTTPRIRRTHVLAVIAITITAVLGGTAAHADDGPPLPSRMAALGDSITQASASCGLVIVCPWNSWSTGWTGSVNSHASRLRAAGAPLWLAFNDAAPGAASGDLPGQAARAVAQGAQYVTVEIGANDACTSSVGAMTPVDTYRANVSAALATLAGSSAQPQIFVASIPSLMQVWAIGKDNPRARLAWRIFGSCPSMLANPTSTAPDDVARRAAVQQQVDAYNAVLSDVCSATANCRYDGGAVAGYSFTSGDLSSIDWFHPSQTGQANLAAVTWAHTVWAQ